MQTVSDKINLTHDEFVRLVTIAGINLGVYLEATDGQEKAEVVNKLWSACQTIHHKLMDQPEAIALIGKGRSPMPIEDILVSDALNEQMKQDIENEVEPVTVIPASHPTFIEPQDSNRLQDIQWYQEQHPDATVKDITEYANAQEVLRNATRNQESNLPVKVEINKEYGPFGRDVNCNPKPGCHVVDLSQADYAQWEKWRTESLRKAAAETS